MENGQIHAAADLSVDLLIVVSEFFQTFLQVLEIIFFGISTSQNWHNHRDHSDLKLFAFEVGFFPASHNALRS